jgi:hypothetical protein
MQSTLRILKQCMVAVCIMDENKQREDIFCTLSDIHFTTLSCVCTGTKVLLEVVPHLLEIVIVQFSNISTAQVRARRWNPPLSTTRRVILSIGQAFEDIRSPWGTNHEICDLQQRRPLRITHFCHASEQETGQKKHLTLLNVLSS